MALTPKQIVYLEKRAYGIFWRTTHRDYFRKYRKAHLEKSREYSRNYKRAHPEQIKEGCRKYRATHPKRCRERARAYYKTHREEYIARARKWREAHPEQAREDGRKYYRKHLERCRESDREHYKAHREQYLARARKWTKTHPEKNRGCVRAYAKAHPERLKHYFRRYFKAHLEEYRDSSRKFRKAHPELICKYAAKHRKKGFSPLAPNIFDCPVDWHHVSPNHPHVVPLPRAIHRKVYGKYHFVFNAAMTCCLFELDLRERVDTANSPFSIDLGGGDLAWQTCVTDCSAYSFANQEGGREKHNSADSARRE